MHFKQHSKAKAKAGASYEFMIMEKKSINLWLQCGFIEQEKEKETFFSKKKKKRKGQQRREYKNHWEKFLILFKF